MDDLARNAAEHRSSEIDRMIAGENDPDKRANLIILNSINNCLVTNTETMQTMNTRMENHLVDYREHVRKGDALFNTGRGIWYVLSVVFLLAQGVGGWGLLKLNSNLESLRDTDIRVEGRVATIEGAIRGITKGDAGATGATGAVGITGRTGETGDVGPKGERGKNFWGK